MKKLVLILLLPNIVIKWTLLIVFVQGRHLLKRSRIYDKKGFQYITPTRQYSTNNTEISDYLKISCRLKREKVGSINQDQLHRHKRFKRSLDFPYPFVIYGVYPSYVYSEIISPYIFQPKSIFFDPSKSDDEDAVANTYHKDGTSYNLKQSNVTSKDMNSYSLIIANDKQKRNKNFVKKTAKKSQAVFTKSTNNVETDKFSTVMRRNGFLLPLYPSNEYFTFSKARKDQWYYSPALYATRHLPKTKYYSEVNVIQTRYLPYTRVEMMLSYPMPFEIYRVFTLNVKNKSKTGISASKKGGKTLKFNIILCDE